MARRHGLSPEQLFGWRRQLRAEAGSSEAGRDRNYKPEHLTNSRQIARRKLTINATLVNSNPDLLTKNRTVQNGRERLMSFRVFGKSRLYPIEMSAMGPTRYYDKK